MTALRERAEQVRFRAEEEAAHVQNDRLDRLAREAEHRREISQFEAERAAGFVAEFLEEPFSADQLAVIDIHGWKKAWAFDLPDFGPMQVRLNSFYGLRLMDGSREGDGRLVRILADLIEPTSSESRSAADDDARRRRMYARHCDTSDECSTDAPETAAAKSFLRPLRWLVGKQRSVRAVSALANVRNASRDVAEGLRRFERDFARLKRATQAAVDEGHPEPEILAALNEAVKGNPDLADRMRDFMQRMEHAA